MRETRLNALFYSLSAIDGAESLQALAPVHFNFCQMSSKGGDSCSSED